MSFRDSTLVILDTGRTLIRAGVGIHELLKRPTAEISARVGLRRDAFPDAAQVHDPKQASTSKEAWPSTLPHYSSPSAKVNDYLVGKTLDDALAAGQDILVSWPFADGDIRDWVQAEALWKHILFTELSLRRVQNESPVIFSYSAGLARATYERICQMFFERFNVAGLSIVERPVAQLYAANSISGIVVDIGMDRTDITPIFDGLIGHQAVTVFPVGIRDCQAYLAQLFRSNQSMMATLSSAISPEEMPSALLALAEQIWQDRLVKVPSDGETVIVATPNEEDGVVDLAAIVMAGKEKSVVESNQKKRATAKASAAEQARAREIEAMDLITVDFRGHSITMGKERHRFCEPLFDPLLLMSVDPRFLAEGLEGRTVWSLQDAVGHAVSLADVDSRQYIWGGLFVTGELSNRVPGIPMALQSRLKPFIVGNPHLESDVQARAIRVIAVPEYFAEFRERDMSGEWRSMGNGLSSFLGTSIVAKITFNDSHAKNYASKVDYNAKGPRAIIEMSPALL